MSGRPQRPHSQRPGKRDGACPAGSSVASAVHTVARTAHNARTRKSTPAPRRHAKAPTRDKGRRGGERHRDDHRSLAVEPCFKKQLYALSSQLHVAMHASNDSVSARTSSCDFASLRNNSRPVGPLPSVQLPTSTEPNSRLLKSTNVQWTERAPSAHARRKLARADEQSTPPPKACEAQKARKACNRNFCTTEGMAGAAATAMCKRKPRPSRRCIRGKPPSRSQSEPSHPKELSRILVREATPSRSCLLRTPPIRQCQAPTPGDGGKKRMFPETLEHASACR